MISVLQIGQSNAVGLGLGGILGAAIDHKVTAWNNSNTTVERESGTAYVDPVLGAKPLNHNGYYQNSGIWFCSKLAKLTGDNVRFMLVAKGATGIEAYDDRTSNPFLLNEVKVNWLASGNGPADFLIHCGHENNRGYSLAEYGDKQDHIIATLLAEGVISTSTVIIITGLAEREPDHKALNDNVLKPYCALHGYSYGSSSGLAQQPLPDLSHFVGQAYIQMGMDRIFEALPAGSFELAELPSDLASYGVASNGEYWCYQDGRKTVRWMPILDWAYPNVLYGLWKYPVAFKNSPMISHTVCTAQSIDMGTEKIGGSILTVDSMSNELSQIKLISGDLYATGSEKIGVILEATGC